MRSAVEEEENDEVCNRIMTRSAYNQKKFVNRRMTRSAFKQQKERQGDRKPQQRRQQQQQQKKSEPVRIPLTRRERQMRDFTPEEREAYSKKLRETEGFDVGKLPRGIILSRAIREIPLDSHYGIRVYCTTSAKRALRDYNKENHSKYQFIKLIRVCYGPVVGTMYYITFQAKQDGKTRNFQARVRRFLGTHIEFCREEKNPNLTEGPGETSQQ